MLEKGIQIKTKDEIALMRKACRLTADILDAVGAIIRPGISTEEINTFVHQQTTAAGAIPAPLNYKGFPKSCCTSPNEVVCHGVPGEDVILHSGDIVNVDVTSILNGYHGDSSRMYYVGGEQQCAKNVRKLVDSTYKALYIGIKQAKSGNTIGDIGAAIQQYVKSSGQGYGIVREYTGHGIGKDFHEPPHVLHYGVKGTGSEIKPGMIFTIEPMLNMGVSYTVLDKKDNWTVRTKDGLHSAQWEHTVLITDTGCEILTLSAKEREEREEREETQ